jgi:hypothetical protein
MGLDRSVWRSEAKALGCVGALRVCLRRCETAVSVDVIENEGSHRSGRYGWIAERDKIEGNAESVYFADAECE